MRTTVNSFSCLVIELRNFYRLLVYIYLVTQTLQGIEEHPGGEAELRHHVALPLGLLPHPLCQVPRLCVRQTLHLHPPFIQTFSKV